MADHFAIKRLTASDCSLFEAVYRTIDADSRIGIGLNAKVLAGQFYRKLAVAALETNNEVLLGLTIYGPDAKPAHCLTRMIVQRPQAEDWILTGERVRCPWDDPARYNNICPGDLAVMAFTGIVKPARVDIVLLSRAATRDVPAIEALAPLVGERAMIAVTSTQIRAALQGASIAETHPVRMTAADADRDAAMEDAAMGGVNGPAWLARNRINWPVSISELSRNKRDVEATDREGKGVANLWLSAQVSNGHQRKYEWISEENAVTACDFEAYEVGGMRTRFTAKSTRGPFDNTIHLSLAEVIMAASGIPYRIVRVFHLEDFRGKIRVSEDIGPFARELLALNNHHMPAGAGIDAFSVAPTSLVWGDEMSAEWPDEELVAG